MFEIQKSLGDLSNYDELMRAAGCRVPEDRGTSFKQALVGSIKKAFSESGTLGLGSGFVEYNLDEAVKHLYPIQTPALNENLIGQAGGQEGTKREYRAIAKVNTNNLSGATPFAGDSVTGRGTISKIQTFPRFKTFFKLLPEFQVDRGIAQLSGKLKAYAQELIASMAVAKIISEQNLMFNVPGLRGNPVLATPGNSTTGGTLAAGTYTFSVTALNYWGQRLFSSVAVAGDIPALVAGVRYGESGSTASGNVVTTGATSSVTLAWPNIVGAWAYNVYATLSGVSYYIGTYANNAATITSLSAALSPVSPPTVDATDVDLQNQTTGYDGMYSQFLPDSVLGSSLQAEVIRNATPAALTASTGGTGIKEFDMIFEALYRKQGLGPDVVFANTLDWGLSISPLLTSSVAQNYRINVDSGTDARISAGVIVDTIKNQFARKPVDVILHPLMPRGKLMFYTKNLPYENNNTGVNMTHFYNEWMRQVFFPNTSDVAPPGPWGISSIGNGILTYPNSCGLIENFT